MLQHNVNVVLQNTDYACSINDGTHQYIVDEPLSNGGTDAGPNPYSYFLASLGSCTAITIKMYAKRKGWELDGVRISLNLFHKTENGQRITVLTRSIHIKSNLTNEQLERLQQIAKACPVSKILEGAIQIDTVVKPQP